MQMHNFGIPTPTDEDHFLHHNVCADRTYYEADVWQRFYSDAANNSMTTDIAVT